VLLALAGFAAVGGSQPASASAAKSPLPVTFVGDSVSASIAYVPTAQARLRRAMILRLDVAVCRRLVQASCTFQGETPTSALQAVRSYGRSLGTVLVVNVGYNEDGRGYGSGIDKVMRAALAQGVRGVVWVTLREQGPYARLYAGTNRAIRKAAGRWPELRVAHWNSYSAGKPWFAGDGLHLTPAGAVELSAFLRPVVLRAAAGRR
jgi:hypothetical protein